jgi:Tfp pilus assembly protein PilV
MMKILKRYSALRKDEGLSLAEVLIAVGLTGLLALGCTQLALASFTSAKYTQAVAAKSIDSGNANRMITLDMENSLGFMVPSTPETVLSALDCSTDKHSSQSAEAVRALLTLENTDGSTVGYEVRTFANAGQLWRVSCSSAGNPNGPEQMVRGSLPISTDASWDSAVMCASFPAGGSLTTAQCVHDVALTSITANPGVIFTIPAGSTSAQIIVAARNIG